jgi:hypothetical protein
MNACNIFLANFSHEFNMNVTSILDLSPVFHVRVARVRKFDVTYRFVRELCKINEDKCIKINVFVIISHI